MFVEIINRKHKGSSLLIQVEGEDGVLVFPTKLRSPDGVTYRAIRKPEYGDYFEIRPDGGTWGTFKDTLEIIP